MKKIKLLLCIIFVAFSFNSLYAVNLKYVPSNSEILFSMNIGNILKKISAENFELLVNSLDSEISGSLDYFLANDSGISRNYNIKLFVIGLDDEVEYEYDEYQDDDNYIIGLLVPLADSSKFERFMLGFDGDVSIDEYQNYKAINVGSDDVIISFNDEICSIVFAKGNSNLEITNYKNIIEDIFNSNNTNKKFDIFKKNKNDFYLLGNLDIIYDILDLGDMLDIDGSLYTDKDYATFALNFNKNDISLDIDLYDNSIGYNQLKLKKALNKSVYKYIEGDKNLGFASLSLNVKNYYNALKMVKSRDEAFSIFDEVLEEYNLTSKDLSEILGGDFFVSLWETEIPKEAFEGMSEEDIEQYMAMLEYNPLAKLNGMGAISISDQKKYEQLINILIENETLVEDTISGVNIYRTYTDPILDENSEPVIHEATGNELSAMSSIVLYQEGDIVYISPYMNIKNIIDGTYKVKQSKTIKQFADKNMFSLYIDIKTVLNMLGLNEQGSEEERELLGSLSGLYIITNIIGESHSKTTLKLELEGNKGNSINWAVYLLDML